MSDVADRPKVSVSMITYNQERYIAEAIEGALMQETDFPFEIVISDDKSTDTTLDICRRFQSQHPDKIRLIERSTNVGAVRNYYDTYMACEGKYVAFCEGDDFWTGPKKLQKQVDFLDANPDYAICCHNVHITDSESKIGPPLFSALQDTSTVFDLCKGDFISTPSCMVRRNQFGTIPDWLYGLHGADWPFDILHAEHGKIKFLPDLMAAYRQHGTSMWSSVDREGQLLIAIKLAKEMNIGFGRRYDKSFNSFISMNYRALAMLHDSEAETPKPDRSVLRKWISPRWRKVKPHIKQARLKIAGLAGL